MNFVTSKVMELVLALALSASMLGSCGCEAPQAFPKEFGQVARQISTSVTSQTLWGDVLARLEGEVIEPGIEVGAGHMYIAYSKLPGVSGRVRLEAEGAGNQILREDAVAAVLKLVDDPVLAHKIVDKIFEERKAAAEVLANQDQSVPATQPVPE